MHIPWEDLEVFLAVAEEGSLSGAARHLGVTQPTVSRRMSALEERLKKQLFVRDAEGARLTDEGARLRPSARQMARFAEQFERVADRDDARPRGMVRVGVGVSWAIAHALAAARDLRKAAPRVSLEVLTQPRTEDLFTGALDLLLDTREHVSPRVETIERVQVPFGAFSSKAYARRIENKKGKADLDARDVEWIAASANDHELTEVLGDDVSKHVSLCADDEGARLRAVDAGLGAMLLPTNPAPAGLAPLNISRAKRSRQLVLVASRASESLPQVRWVKDALRSTWGSMGSA